MMRRELSDFYGLRVARRPAKRSCTSRPYGRIELTRPAPTIGSAAGETSFWRYMTTTYKSAHVALTERGSSLSAEDDWFDNFGSAAPEDAGDWLRPHHPAAPESVAGRRPVTARLYLFVGQILNEQTARADERGNELLAALREQPHYCEHQYRFRRHPGSVALWDCCAPKHQTVSDYAPGHVME